MKRLISPELVAWKNSARRKPLIVRGARQVGKTHSIRSFGEEYFDECASIDLERNRRWHRIFADDLDAHRILSELRVVLDKSIEPGRTLLFFDEIQSCPRAIMALRYLYEEVPELHVIAAGSLLDFALSDISFPVGRVQFLEMSPLVFAEYLWAMGRDRSAEVVLAKPGRVPDSVHASLLADLRDYFFVGGMPESVLAYERNRSIRDSRAVHHELCESYRQDFAKYAPRADPYCLDAVLAGTARQVGRQVKYTSLAEGYSGPTIKRAFDLLTKARVARKVSATTPAGLPLGAAASPRRFKALMVDIGLMQHLRGVPIDLEYGRVDLLKIHLGDMAEQFVGQEMLVSQGTDLHYWSRQAKSSTAEVDFLAVIGGSIVPIEVKSGPSGRLRSLHLLLKSYPNCERAYVFSSAPYAELPEQKLIFLPLYYAYRATLEQAVGD
ncbi:MAG: nuclease [Gemmatimonas sp. SG8_17]|nr:MAG: nuclease [Gemmatimonas sp. SG8_17]